MPKKAYFGTKMAVLGPNILIILGRSKRFGTHITEKPPRHLVRIFFFGRAWDQMTKNAYFGPNLAVFGPKALIFYRSK